MSEIQLPKPKPEKEKVNTTIDSYLMEQVRALCKRNGLKINDAVEYGLKKFIEGYKK